MCVFGMIFGYLHFKEYNRVFIVDLCRRVRDHDTLLQNNRQNDLLGTKMKFYHVHRNSIDIEWQYNVHS